MLICKSAVQQPYIGGDGIKTSAVLIAILGRSASSAWLRRNTKWLRIGRCSAMVDIRAPVPTKGLRHPMALAPIGDSSSSAFVLGISSLESPSGTASLRTSWLSQCVGENSSDCQKIRYGMSYHARHRHYCIGQVWSFPG
ncbi:uncharacterized protein LOC124699004 isoform X1 [Lolium rigidum]|uniref:uncharacterized protein LOC124699004 isoform X1 n=1 Tax=Lolium rigidum TaxID=89674 RepID=UPI001F5DB2A5|nr:uncharacterized protein LOC124699004 isoform X1 [Lolium rigidum]